MKISTQFSLFLIVYSLCHTGFAQQLPVISQYMENPVFLNPGATAADGKSTSQLLYRIQWAGYESYDPATGAAPQLQLFTTAIRLKNHADSVVRNSRHGLGIIVLHDRLAAFTTTEGKISYAYHLPFTKKSTLALGVRVGWQNRAIDYAKFRVKHPDDEWLPDEGRKSEGSTVLAFGLWYEHEKYYVGLAMDGVGRSSFEELGVSPNRNWTFTAGYHIAIGAKEWTLTPNLMAVSNSEEYLVAGGLKVSYQNNIWVGATYRHEEAVSAMFGIGLLKEKRLWFSYAVDYVTDHSEIKASTSHEAMIGYRWK